MLIVICQLDKDIVIPQQCLNASGLMFNDDLLEEVICKLGFEGGIVIGEKKWDKSIPKERISRKIIWKYVIP